MSLPLARRGWLALLIAMAAITPVSTSFGATYTWTGTGSGNNWYQTNGTTVLNSNWSNPGSTLTSADTVVFGTSSKTTATINTNSAASVTGVVFDVGAPAYTISGGNGSSNLVVTGSIVNLSSNLQTITTNGQIGFGNGLVIDTGAGGITFSRNSTSPNTANITKQGSGTLTWGNASSYTGTMTNTAGTFDGSNSTFGGSIVNSATVVGINTISGNFSQSAGSATIGSVQGTTTISGGSATINNVIGLLTVSGGTLTTGNINDFTTLSGGVLQISSGGFVAQSITQTGGYLTSVTGNGVDMGEALTISSGTADIATAKSINSSNGAVVNLAANSAISQSSTMAGVTNISGPVGANATFNGPLTLGSTGTFDFDINNAGIGDNVSANSGVTYGGTMAINLAGSGTAANDTDWQLFSAPSYSGTFGGITLASTQYGNLSFGLSTSSTDYFDQKYGPGVWLSDWSGGQRFIFNQANGTLTIVPEPSTFVFAGIGAAMVGWHTWTRGRRKARLKLIEEHTRKLGVERGLV